MLIDDDENIDNFFIDLLRETGYDVSDLLTLFYYYDIHHYDNQIRLVLIDNKMPQITGCELANKIAE